MIELSIKAGTSQRGCCPECGAPWVRVVEREGETAREKLNTAGPSASAPAHATPQGINYAGGHGSNLRKATTTGWAPTCLHRDDYSAEGPPVVWEVEPCTVFDPFLGSGTVGMSSESLGRKWHGCELSAKYVEMIKRRVSGPLFAGLIE